MYDVTLNRDAFRAIARLPTAAGKHQRPPLICLRFPIYSILSLCLITSQALIA